VAAGYIIARLALAIILARHAVLAVEALEDG
jgi:hypothetical protein